MRVIDLVKTYKTKSGSVQALKGVSFDLPDNGMVFILGRSGCGKSTLLNVLSGLDNFDDGDVIVDGKSLKDLSFSELDDYRNSICGFVFQEYNLIPELDVFDNIALALELRGEKEVAKKVSEALEKVGLGGYEKRKISTLSGGQKQRIAIARSIIKDPRIIFADEPSGALDSDTGASIFELLKELSKDRLVLVVSHDRESANKYGDRIIELSDGKVIGDTFGDFEDKDKEPFLNTKKHKLPLRSAIGIGCSNFKMHPFRLIATILLAVFSFTLFGISLAYDSLDGVNQLADAIYESDTQYIAISKHRSTLYDDDVGLTDLITKTYTIDFANFKQSDIDFLQSYSAEKSMFTYMFLSGIGRSYVPDTYAYTSFVEKAEEHITYQTSGYISITEEECQKLGFEIIGRLPITDNEAAISECQFNQFKYFNFINENDELITVQTPEDILGTYDPVTKLTITGVVITSCDNECSKTHHPNNGDENSPIITPTTHPEFFPMDNKYIFHDKTFVTENYILSNQEIFNNNEYNNNEQKKFIIVPLPKNKQNFINLTRYIVKNNGYHSAKEFYEIENPLGKYYFEVLLISHPLSMIFMYLGIVFFIFSVILLLNFITSSIRGQMKEIGIISALGGNFKNIYTIYTLNSLIVCGIIYILSTTAVGVIIALLNASGKALLWLNVVGAPFSILSLNFTTIISMLIIAVATAVLGTIISLRKMRRLSPADIIRKGQIK